ncbi:MAG: MFS transporter [Legionellaceae bacterium]
MSDVSRVPAGYKAWLVCLSAGLFFFYEFFQLNLFDVINVPLRDAFQLDAAQLSWLSSSYLWANVLFLLPAGFILDRYSTRRVILMAMLVCLIGTLGFAFSTNFSLAFFFHALAGIGNAFCFLSCVVLVSRWFEPRRQALMIGLIVTMAFIGGMMAHTPLAYLNDVYGWRHALLMDAGLGLIIFIWLCCTVKDSPKGLHLFQMKAPAPHFLTVVSNRQNWLAGLYTACLNLPIMVLCALWGANYLEVVHHVPLMNASTIVSMILMGSIVGCPLAGYASDALGRRKPLMLLGALATCLTLLPLLLNVVLSQAMLVVIFFCLGFFSSTQVIGYPLIAESNSSRNTGVATSIASILIMGGAGLGQIVFGLIMYYHAGMKNTNYTAADFEFAFWLFPIAALLAFVAILFARETYCLEKIKHGND